MKNSADQGGCYPQRPIQWEVLKELFNGQDVFLNQYVNYVVPQCWITNKVNIQKDKPEYGTQETKVKLIYNLGKRHQSLVTPNKNKFFNHYKPNQQNILGKFQGINL